MLKGKRIIIVCIMILILTTVYVTYDNNNPVLINDFSEDKVMDHIKELSSDRYEGRLAGSKGDKLAGEYIANQFEKYGLKPGGDNGTYFQKFRTTVPRLNSTPILRVKDQKGNIIKDYIHREDFYELTSGCAGSGNASGIINIISNASESKGKPIVLYNKSYDQNFRKELLDTGVKAFITPGKYDITNKKIVALGEYSGTNNKFAHIIISNKAYNELIEYSNKGYILDVAVDLKYENIETRNIIGYIEGTNEYLEKDMLTITAHYDHIGIDPDGTVFGGALDNASGISTVMELARLISKTNPKRTVAFVAFDSEEVGLQGSKKYARKPFRRAENNRILNLDMIGTKENVKLSLEYSSFGKQPNQFVKDLVKILEENKIEFQVYNTSRRSDHYSFNECDIDAVSFIDPGMKNIHTKSDDISNIDKNRIKKISVVPIEYMNQYAIETHDLYRLCLSEKQIEIANYVPIYVAVLIVIFIIIILVISKLKKNKDIQEKILKRGIFTALTVLITMFAIFVFNNYLWEDEIKERADIQPLYTNVEVEDGYEKIIDINVDKEITAILSNKKGIYKIKFDHYGDIVDDVIRLDDGSNVSYKIMNGYIYNIKDSKLYKESDSNTKAIFNNVVDFDVFNVNGDNFITAYNDNELIYKVNDKEYKIPYDSIKTAKFSADKNQNVHVLLSSKGIIRHVVLDKNGKEVLSNELDNIKLPDSFKFGIDENYGYIIYENQGIKMYSTFSLKSKQKPKTRKLEVHDRYGALVEIKDIEISKYSDKEGYLNSMLTGLTQNGYNYGMLVKFKKGSLFNNKVVWEYKGENNIMSSTFVTSYEDNQYVGVIKGNSFCMKSSNVMFGENYSTKTILSRIYRVMQNFIMMFFVLISRVIWILVGYVFFLIWYLIKKHEYDNDTWIVLLPITLYMSIQLMSSSLSSIFGYRYDFILVSFVIGIISGIYTLLYKYEKGKVSSIRLYTVYAVINLLLIASIYTPYILKHRMYMVQ
ncbi:M28 family metallopeptidase [Clostridiaceae bacterium M8S5]|nr:M28 family metallopeptidase [Clostridiaceae bacterium M8S5]